MLKSVLNAQGVGGKIGALTDYRLQVINPTQNQLGQLAITLADSMNTQNKLGLTRKRYCRPGFIPFAGVARVGLYLQYQQRQRIS